MADFDVSVVVEERVESAPESVSLESGDQRVAHVVDDSPRDDVSDDVLSDSLSLVEEDVADADSDIEEDDELHDLTKLTELTDDTLCEAVKLRYAKDLIYVCIRSVAELKLIGFRRL